MASTSSSQITPAARQVDVLKLAAELIECLKYRVGKEPSVATRHDWLAATIKVVRDRLVDCWIDSTRRAYENGDKRVYYLSMEFLIGRLMRDAFSNLGIMEDKIGRAHV